MKRFFFLVVALCCVASVGAQVVYHAQESYLIGQLYYSPLTDSTVEVLTNQDLCSPYPMNVTVPESVEIDGRQYTVTRIGESAFNNNCGSISSITLPNTIVEIGESAFLGFQHPLSLPPSVRRIEKWAFSNCLMDTLRIPQGVEEIVEDAFCINQIGLIVVDEGNSHFVSPDSVALFNADTTVLLAYSGRWPSREYTVPQTVLRIGNSVFYGNTSLRNVVLPEGLQEMGDMVFGRFTAGLHIPASVRRIEGSLRDTASARFNLTIDPANTHYRLTDGNLLSMDGDTLLMALGATGEYTVPDGVRVISKEAFFNNRSLQRVNLPDGLREVLGSAFNNCSADVSLPPSLLFIAEGAFYKSGIKTASIPSLREIGDMAFSNSSLERVVDTRRLRSIGNRAFEVSQLKNIEFGDSLEWIGGQAFEATKLRGEITLPASLRGIGMSAIVLGNITKVNFLGPVDTIGTKAVRSKLVDMHHQGSQLPVTYGIAFLACDTVYTPCGLSLDFGMGIGHEEGTKFKEFCSTEGVDEAGLRVSLSLYPNPAHGMLSLTGLPQEGGKISVVDMAGREVLKAQAFGEQTQMDISSVAPGVYLLRVTSSDAVQTLRLVVD